MLRADAVGLYLCGCLLQTGCGDDPASNEADAPAAELWFAGSVVSGLSREQVRTGAAEKPALVGDVAVEGAGPIVDLAIDPQGNVWLVLAGQPNVYRFPSLRRSGEMKPDLVLHSPQITNPGNLELDSNGSVWVANRAGTTSVDDGTILRLDVSASEAGERTLDASLEIRAARKGDLAQLGHLAFDAQQNLWVTSFAGLLRYDDPRAATGALALEPGAVIDKRGYPSNIYFYSATFDATGNLWASSADGLHYLTSVSKFEDPGTLTGRTSPPIAATILGAMGELPSGGVTFDAAGDLWLATERSLLRYAQPGALQGTQDLSPASRIMVPASSAPTTNSHIVFTYPAEP